MSLSIICLFILWQLWSYFHGGNKCIYIYICLGWKNLIVNSIFCRDCVCFFLKRNSYDMDTSYTGDLDLLLGNNIYSCFIGLYDYILKLKNDIYGIRYHVSCLTSFVSCPFVADCTVCVFYLNRTLVYNCLLPI